MSAKVQESDLEIDEDNRRSAASAPAPYLCLPTFGGCNFGYAVTIQLVIR